MVQTHFEKMTDQNKKQEIGAEKDQMGVPELAEAQENTKVTEVPSPNSNSPEDVEEPFPSTYNGGLWEKYPNHPRGCRRYRDLLILRRP